MFNSRPSCPKLSQPVYLSLYSMLGRTDRDVTHATITSPHYTILHYITLRYTRILFSPYHLSHRIILFPVLTRSVSNHLSSNVCCPFRIVLRCQHSGRGPATWAELQ
jgi:hypothetical protein